MMGYLLLLDLLPKPINRDPGLILSQRYSNPGAGIAEQAPQNNNKDTPPTRCVPWHTHKAQASQGNLSNFVPPRYSSFFYEIY
jgi:hypothetical protein